jgi:hypothetical protein
MKALFIEHESTGRRRLREFHRMRFLWTRNVPKPTDSAAQITQLFVLQLCFYYSNLPGGEGEVSPQGGCVQVQVWPVSPSWLQVRPAPHGDRLQGYSHPHPPRTSKVSSTSGRPMVRPSRRRLWTHPCRADPADRTPCLMARAFFFSKIPPTNILHRSGTYECHTYSI